MGEEGLESRYYLLSYLLSYLLTDSTFLGNVESETIDAYDSEKSVGGNNTCAQSNRLS